MPWRQDPLPTACCDAQGVRRSANAAWQAARLEHRCPVNHRELVRAVLAGGHAIEGVETQQDKRDWRWTYWPAGEPGQVMVRAQPLHGLRQREREAERARRQYRLILDNTSDVISRHRADGRFLWVSPSAQAVLGWGPDALEGRMPGRLIRAGDWATLRHHLRAVLESPGHAVVRFRLRDRSGNGSERWLESSVRAIWDVYGERPVEWLAVTRDVTERLAQDRRQRQLETELAHATRRLTFGEMASGIAHEVSQPLAAISNYAAVASRLQRDPERLQACLQRVRQQADHAGAILQRLKGLLRARPGELVTVSLQQLAEEALQLCRWEAEVAGIRLQNQVPDGLPALTLDRVLGVQVLVNLIRNGVQAGVAGQGRVQLLAGEDEGGLWLQVRDNGPVSADTDLGAWFEPFRTSRADGMGLGLSMSRTLMEGMGGQLEACIGPEGGVRMTCRWPAVLAAGH